MINDRQQANTLHIFPAGARAAARSNAQTASNVTRQGAEAAQRGSEAVAEMARRAGDVAGETMRRGVQVAAEGQRQLAQDATEQFADVSQTVAQTVQGTTEGLRTLMVLPNAARSGLQDLQQGVTDLFEGIVRANVRATQELFRLYNPSAVIALQQRFAREYVDALVEGSATLVRAARRTADEALRPLEQQIEQRRQARQDGQRYQHAAE